MPSCKRKRLKRNSMMFKDKKKAWKKLLKQKHPKLTRVLIEEEQINAKIEKVVDSLKYQTKSATVEKSWDRFKSTSRNFNEMGLTLNPNKILSSTAGVTEVFNSKPRPPVKYPVTKPEVVTELEARVEKQEKFKERVTLPQFQRHLFMYMKESHGDNFKAMVKDRKNIFQLTESQMRKKMRAYDLSWKPHAVYAKTVQK